MVDSKNREESNRRAPVSRIAFSPSERLSQFALLIMIVSIFVQWWNIMVVFAF